MSRRRLLIAYDISDPRRLRRVIAIMESYGTRLQYSVFLCDLSRAESLVWEAEILEVVELSEDSVVTIDLGVTARSTPIRMIGRRRTLPPKPGMII